MIDTDEIAQQTLDIIPLVMRVMSSVMRSGGHRIAPGHVSILGMLSERSYTLGELAEMLVVSAPTMSNTITALEERGWVTRTRSTEDRRVVLVEIAPVGVDVLKTINDHTRDRITALLDGLTHQEREQLTHGLSILRTSFYQALERGREDAGASPSQGEGSTS